MESNAPEKTGSDRISMAILATKMDYMKEAIDKLDDKVSLGYVTKEEFDPIKRVVYGMVTAILLTVLAGGMAIILR